MDAKYLLAKLRASQLRYEEQSRAADVLWDLMKSCGIIKADDPLWQRPPTTPRHPDTYEEEPTG